MRIWITRPAEDAAELASSLRAEGIEVLIEPLLRIAFAAGPPLDLTGVQALLATSANGVRAFARRNRERDIRVLAVGDATARIACEAGFARVESASGDVTGLAELVRRSLDPASGPLLHVTATQVAGDLGGALAHAGFAYRREVLYEAGAVNGLSQELASSLDRTVIDGVLVFSPADRKDAGPAATRVESIGRGGRADLLLPQPGGRRRRRAAGLAAGGGRRATDAGGDDRGRRCRAGDPVRASRADFALLKQLFRG